MEDTIVIAGRKYRLTPVEDDPQALIDQFKPSPTITAPSRHEKTPDSPPIAEEIKTDNPNVKLRTPSEMILKSAERLARAKVEKAKLNRQMDKDYYRVIGRHYSNKEFFYGEGITDAQQGSNFLEEDF